MNFNKRIKWITMFIIGIILVFVYEQESMAFVTPVYVLHLVNDGNILSFLSFIFLIGGSIMLTLTYVSWRKFKANQVENKIKKQKTNR